MEIVPILLGCCLFESRARLDDLNEAVVNVLGGGIKARGMRRPCRSKTGARPAREEGMVGGIAGESQGSQGDQCSMLQWHRPSNSLNV